MKPRFLVVLLIFFSVTASADLIRLDAIAIDSDAEDFAVGDFFLLFESTDMILEWQEVVSFSGFSAGVFYESLLRVPDILGVSILSQAPNITLPTDNFWYFGHIFGGIGYCGPFDCWSYSMTLVDEPQPIWLLMGGLLVLFWRQISSG